MSHDAIAIIDYGSQTAQLIARRFDIACRRLGLARRRDELDRTQFRRPGEMPQMALF